MYTNQSWLPSSGRDSGESAEVRAECQPNIRGDLWVPAHNVPLSLPSERTFVRGSSSRSCPAVHVQETGKEFRDTVVTLLSLSGHFLPSPIYPVKDKLADLQAAAVTVVTLTAATVSHFKGQTHPHLPDLHRRCSGSVIEQWRLAESMMRVYVKKVAVRTRKIRSTAGVKTMKPVL